MKTYKAIKSGIFILSFLLFQPIATSKDIHNQNMNKTLINSIDNFKNICFTRFVMNIPKNSQTVYGRLSVGAELTRIENGAEKIDEIIRDDIRDNTENAKLFHSNNEADKIAGVVLPILHPDVKQLVTVSGFETYIVHSYFKLAQDAYISPGGSVTASSIHQNFKDDIEVFKHLRARKDDEIPTEPGICIDGAFSTLETPYESIEFGVRLTDFPDVHFSFQSIKSGNKGMKLELRKELEEGKQNARATGLGTWVKKLKVLRLDKRTVNDWHGEEMLLHIPSGNGKPSYHKFIFRSLSIGDDPLHPYVEMTLDTGVVDNQSASREPSLSDEEALALWDRLLNSIRVRPNAVAAGSRDSVQTEN
ncbi:T6SS immunity protein Tli4 family protein [Duganella qianjiadongensis]|uniref:Tle cognate immunity protein 4 C-terminal domain-containing protein n=1 Tax=Duganella qianjiadongensis TaxID=2692176 RepID=A0ABW9VRL9_9BURK|nr:T6SS immunity protein Tli4 family protein [Duganella qianjiadongensis]MYM41260.1 hypothetical protein [Duganella qianjiadongensis]